MVLTQKTNMGFQVRAMIAIKAYDVRLLDRGFMVVFLSANALVQRRGVAPSAATC